MQRFAVTVAVCLCVVHRVCTSAALADDTKVSFLSDVAPILVQRCQGCHGPQQNESNYRLDSVVELQKLGDFGEPIVTPGSLDESLLWRLVNSQDDIERMPKDGEPIPEKELNLIRRWIEQGAVYDVADPAGLPVAPAYLRTPPRVVRCTGSHHRHRSGSLWQPNYCGRLS